MSPWIEGWNHAADAWFAWMVQRSCAGALAFAAVAAAIAVLRAPASRCSAHLPSRLLLVPLLVFALPVERLLPTGLGAPLPAPAILAEIGASAPPPPQALPQASPVPHGSDEGARTTSTQAPANLAAPTLRAWLLLAWSLATGAAVLHLVRRQLAAERSLARHSTPASAALRREFARCVRAAGVRRDVGLRVTRGLASPLVAGMRRPVVHLPAELVDGAPGQLAFALHHELEHVRRGDAAAAWSTALVCRAFWFHPLVWLAAAMLERWQEYACDEAALARTRSRRAVAADCLFGLLQRACGSPPPAPASPLLLSPRSFVQSRLLRILDPRRSPHPRMSRAAFAACSLFALGALTVARGQDAPAAVVAATPAPLQQQIQRALSEGAAWLIANQQEDGRWAIGADPSGKNQRDHNEVCVTAMAVSALMPGLRTERLRIAQAVRRAAAFLQESQHENGRFGPAEVATMHYAHAHALRALCAVQREWPEQERLACIERGVAYALSARNPYMGWRYAPRDADNDSKITAMMLLGLHDAKKLGIDVDAAAIDQATQLLGQLTDDRGRTGFVSRGQVMSRFTSKKAHFPGTLSEEPTAMHLLVRLAAGEDVTAVETLRRSIALVAALPPEWDEEKGSIDLAYWQFGAEVMAKVGGEEAARWRQRLIDALLPHRIVENGAAHWPAVDAWSHPGMEAYATASAMLALRTL